jgi:hypothetical protein
MNNRLRSEHDATSEPAGGTMGTWNGNRVEFQGRANGRKNGQYRRIEYRCVAEPGARRIAEFEYRFRGDGTWSGSGWGSGGSGSGSGWGSGSGGSGWGSGSGSGSGSGGWGSSGWRYEQQAVSACQRSISDKLIPQYGGYLTPQSAPEVRRTGNSRVQLTGRANYRDGSGQAGEIEYMCTALESNGRIEGSEYRVLGKFSPRNR